MVSCFVVHVSLLLAGCTGDYRMFAKKVLLLGMLVWLQHEKDCFDNPTTHLPYMEGKAMVVALPIMEGKADSKLCCKHSAIYSFGAKCMYHILCMHYSVMVDCLSWA